MADTTPDAPSVTDLIRAQHVEIERLFTDVEGGHGEARRQVFDCLVRLLAVHETAEEEVVYPVVRRADPDGDAIVDARTAEESEAKSLLSELERMGPDHPDFPSKFDDLRVAVLEHARAEESSVLPVLERTQDATKLSGMATALQVAQKLAPTHPHPHGPDSALGNLVMGPMTAIVDRTRDAIRALTR